MAAGKRKRDEAGSAASAEIDPSLVDLEEFINLSKSQQVPITWNPPSGTREEPGMMIC
jgi:hypothetical protein